MINVAACFAKMNVNFTFVKSEVERSVSRLLTTQDRCIKKVGSGEGEKLTYFFYSTGNFVTVEQNNLPSRNLCKELILLNSK